MAWNEDDHARDEQGRFSVTMAFVNKHDHQSPFQILANAKRLPLSVHAEPGVSAEQAATVERTLERVASKISAAGFGRILYGNVHVVPGLDEERHGQYTNGSKDTVHISASNIKDEATLEHVLTHELGHRYEDKYLTSSVRSDFDKIIGGEDVTAHLSHSDREAMADHYIHEQRVLRGDNVPEKPEPAGYSEFMSLDRKGDHSDLLDRFDRGDDTAIPGLREHAGMLHEHGSIKVPMGRVEPVSVSNYAPHDPREQFAEAFAHHVLGKPMPKTVRRFMEKL